MADKTIIRRIMKIQFVVGLGAVIIMAVAEQSLAASQNGYSISLAMPMFALSNSSKFWAVYSIIAAIGLGFFLYGLIQQKRPRKPTREAQTATGQVKRVGGWLRRTAPAQPEQPMDILSIAKPTAALSAVKALAQQPDPEVVDTLISALAYCQLCQVGKDRVQIPNEFVRGDAARALANFSANAFRELTQIMKAIEAVSREAGRKEEEAKKSGRAAKAREDPYYVCLREVLTSLSGLLQFYLAQLPPGEASQAQIREELRRFETDDGQLIKPSFAQDPVYELLKKRLLALSGTAP